MLTRLVTLLFVATVPSAALSSSVFSAWGLGEIVEGTNCRVRSLGGQALAVPSEGRPSFINPASHAGLRVGCLSMNVAPEVTWIQSDRDRNRLVSTALPTLEIVLPLGLQTTGWLGLRQVTGVGYSAVREDSLGSERYQRELTREGGLHCVAAGLAWEGSHWIAVGAEARFLFGRILEKRTLDFSGSLYADTEDEQASSFRGTVWRLGVLIRPHWRTTMGVVLGTPRDLRVSYETTNTIGVEQSWGGNLRFPASMGVGVAVHPWEPLTISVDWWETRWGATRFEETGQRFRNTNAFGLGIELRAAREPKRRFRRQFPLRLGYSRLPWYTAEEDRPRPVETAFSVGTSVPLLGRRGFVDVAIQLGRREASGIRERFLRLNFGAVGFERWARKYD